MQVVDSFFNKRCNLLEVRTIGHAKRDNRQHIAVITRQVFVILRKQLCVLEGDDLAVE